MHTMNNGIGERRGGEGGGEGREERRVRDSKYVKISLKHNFQGQSLNERDMFRPMPCFELHCNNTITIRNQLFLRE